MQTKIAYALSSILSAMAFSGVVLIVASFAPPLLPLFVILGSLRLHIGLVVLATALALLLFGRWQQALLAGGIATATLAQIFFALAPSVTPPVPAGATMLSVMSFNILGDNQWGGKPTAEYMLKALPDIAFIQEARPLHPYLKAMESVYPYHIGCVGWSTKCDSLLLSRHPLGPASYFLPDARQPERFFSTKVSIGGEEITLVAVHLTKVEYGAYQADEYKRAAEEIAAIPGPVVAAGDFNTAPWAPRFVDFLGASGLKHIALEPATWPAGFGFIDDLGVPIDHILVRGGSIAELDTLPDTYRSNHRGLIARLAFPAAQ